MYFKISYTIKGKSHTGTIYCGSIDVLYDLINLYNEIIFYDIEIERIHSKFDKKGTT